MSIFSRITATLSASVEKAVGQIENHDAIIEASIKECRSSLVKARVYRDRVSRDGEQLRKRLKELNTDRQSWEQRARDVADSDRKTALACVQRRNNCQKGIEQTRDALQRHQQLEEKVSRNLARIEQRLSEMTQQRNLMRSRQSAADAQRTLNALGGGSTEEVTDAFERWEIMISEAEYQVGEDPSLDPLEEQFREQEDEMSLQADLHALLNTEGDSSHE